MCVCVCVGGNKKLSVHTKNEGTGTHVDMFSCVDVKRVVFTDTKEWSQRFVGLNKLNVDDCRTGDLMYWWFLSVAQVEEIRRTFSVSDELMLL